MLVRLAPEAVVHRAAPGGVVNPLELLVVLLVVVLLVVSAAAEGYMRGRRDAERDLAESFGSLAQRAPGQRRLP